MFDVIKECRAGNAADVGGVPHLIGEDLRGSGIRGFILTCSS
jgi:hypothetical protein